LASDLVGGTSVHQCPLHSLGLLLVLSIAVCTEWPNKTAPGNFFNAIAQLTNAELIEKQRSICWWMTHWHVLV